mmetsp:Transcript_23344/g.61298  ORF Transcript_23344/g.61298 Transcript_23344/m.61298 type:complete len:331 (-) Transcript_23344:354-1346(-)
MRHGISHGGVSEAVTPGLHVRDASLKPFSDFEKFLMVLLAVLVVRGGKSLNHTVQLCCTICAEVGDALRQRLNRPFHVAPLTRTIDALSQGLCLCREDRTCIADEFIKFSHCLPQRRLCALMHLLRFFEDVFQAIFNATTQLPRLSIQMCVKTLCNSRHGGLLFFPKCRHGSQELIIRRSRTLSKPVVNQLDQRLHLRSQLLSHVLVASLPLSSVERQLFVHPVQKPCFLQLALLHEMFGLLLGSLHGSPVVRSGSAHGFVQSLTQVSTHLVSCTGLLSDFRSEVHEGTASILTEIMYFSRRCRCVSRKTFDLSSGGFNSRVQRLSLRSM